MVSDGMNPVCVPLAMYVGIDGADQTLGPISICTLLPPAANDPSAVSVIPGRLVPHVRVGPLNEFPFAVKSDSSQTCTVPDPGLADVVPGHVTDKEMLVPMVMLVTD
jgi:hypothetical protein